MVNLLSRDYLASRAARFWAAIIDTFVLMGPLLLLVAISEITDVEALTTVGYVALVGVFILQFVLLAKDGQTVGKKVLNIRIVNNDTGEKASFIRIVLLRQILNAIISAFVPFYGIVDVLFIFRQDCRTLHDRIAGTRVILVLPE